MPNRYPKYRLKKAKNFEYSNAAGDYLRRLDPGATCDYFAHSDTYLFDSRDGFTPWFDGELSEKIHPDQNAALCFRRMAMAEDAAPKSKNSDGTRRVVSGDDRRKKKTVNLSPNF